MALECRISHGQLAQPFQVLTKKVGGEEVVGHDLQIVNLVDEDLPDVEAPCETESCAARFNADAISNWVAKQVVNGEQVTCPSCRGEVYQIRLDRTHLENAPADDPYEMHGDEKTIAIAQRIANVLRHNGSVTMADVLDIQEVKALNRERVTHVSSARISVPGEDDEECCADGCKDRVGIIGLIAIIIFAVLALFRAIANLFFGSTVTDDSDGKNRINTDGTLVDTNIMV